MTKILIIFLLCILSITLVKSITTKEEWIKQSKKLQEECRIEVGATKVEIGDLTTTKGKCFRACSMKKHKVMDENGKFCKSATLKNLEILVDGDEEKMKIATAIIEICAETPLPTDHCEAAEVLTQCFDKTSKNLDKLK